VLEARPTRLVTGGDERPRCSGRWIRDFRACERNLALPASQHQLSTHAQGKPGQAYGPVL